MRAKAGASNARARSIALTLPAPTPSVRRMPELPEVETVRRTLESTVQGRTIARARISGLALHGTVPRTLPRRLRGRTIRRIGRHGKFLLIGLDGDVTLLSHLGMSGRWLFHAVGGTAKELPHVHARIEFRDGSSLWFQDPRRFGLLRVIRNDGLARDPSLALLGPDPLATPPSAAGLHHLAGGARLAVKLFLLDQRRIAGLGNIYVSEVLHRAGIDPRRIARSLTVEEWTRVAAEIEAVLREAIERSGTTFSDYRTVWGESGGYGDQLRVYDRAGEPCLRCGGPIRRIVQGQRSTFYCPACQRRKKRKETQTARSAARRRAS